MARRQYFTALRIGTALVALAAAVPVAAQTAQEQEQPAGSQASDEQQAAATNETMEAGATQDTEIVVTARRRAESLQDVPIAVTAYTGEALERQGAIDITDISDTTPNVTLETSRGTNTTLTAFIRGVGQQDPVAGFEAGVGLYLDDVFLNRPQAAVLDIYDVERIEVLRGPQGTLYGRNTIGGAIKYVTRRLDEDPTLRVRANVGSYKQADLILSASAPLTDAVRIGASGARLSRGGFGDNLTNGLENYNRDIWAARGTIEVEPTPDFFIRVSGDYTKDNSDPRNGHRLIPGVLSGAPVLENVYDTRAGLNTPQQEVEAYGGAIRAELKVGEAITLKNILAYRKDRTSTSIDFDALPAADVDVPAIYRNKQFSNEFQILYEGENLQGVAGVYYLDANANNIFDVVLATTGALIGIPGFTASTIGDVDTKTWAVFGDFTYRFTDQLSLSLGGRYTSDKRSSIAIKRNLRGGASPELGGAGVQLGLPTSSFAGEKTFKEFTPRVSVTFEPDDNNTLYATYAKGFKGGSFDPRADSPRAGDSNGNGVIDPEDVFEFFLFDPEKVDSYELGYKASLFDRRLRLALAGFYATYTDVQVPGSVGCVVNGVPTFCGVTENAGKASFKGFEAEVLATLARDSATGSRLNFVGTLGYLDAQYDEYISAIGGTPTDVSDFRSIQNTPKWTVSGTLDYSTPVSTGELAASTTVSYRSATSQFETVSPLNQPGYALWDANLVWTSADDRYSVGLHAKNIGNKRYITSGYQFLVVDPKTGVPAQNAAGNFTPSLGREGVLTAFYGNPRQVFLSFNLNF